MAVLKLFEISAMPDNFACCFVFAVFFLLKIKFFRNSFRNAISLSNSFDQDQARYLSGLIWIKVVCTVYQQPSLVGKYLTKILTDL